MSNQQQLAQQDAKSTQETKEVDKSNVECIYEVRGEEVKLTPTIVANYLAKGDAKVSFAEVTMFINLCKYQKLNPFLNEAYLVKFGSKPAQIITSKEAYMKKAERNKDFKGFKAGLILERNKEIIEVEGSFYGPNDKLLGGWAKVKKEGREDLYIAKVSLTEYNKSQSTWKSMPATMIRKTAIVQALREAFPEDLGALYIEEEVEATTVESTSKTVEEEVKEEINNNANTEVIDIDPKDVQVSEGPGF